MSEKLRFEAQAARWDAHGRAPSLLESGDWQLLALRCWLTSDGARKEGVSPMLAAFVEESAQALQARFPGWYDRLLATRDYCERCGERYLIENLSLCSRCLRTYCYHCTDFPSGPNGNRFHDCGDAGGEIVG